jgi:hypothetical protein
MQHYGDNFVVVVPEEHPLHTPERPFCIDETCLCHEDQEALNTVNAMVQSGLLTPDEATAFIQGRTV